ncbi:hypothetical protein G7046_g3196 [Stylonectria norvegica]|nr:hypothetical protein G7046_g3196 [Stylonectria norvegica]
MSLPWKRLIRFVATDGRILFGEPVDRSLDLCWKATSGLQARVLVGDDIYDVTGKTRLSDEIAEVRTLLGPLTEDNVPLIRCVGLNYIKHIRETGHTPPSLPAVFIKPSTAIVGHDEAILIPKIAQDEQADYEGELCFTILRDAKDVTKEDALSYVAAYTCGNDVSARKLQSDPKLAGSIPQATFSKGFDTFAPLGPCLVAASEIGDGSKLHLKTLVNGEVRQESPVSELLFDCASLISLMSQGTTLKKGTVVMTGTPDGVGFRMRPPKFLKPGDVVEVEISSIGTLRNEVKYE